jgi:hypothetical protein
MLLWRIQEALKTRGRMKTNFKEIRVDVHKMDWMKLAEDRDT